ncbi:carbohydrate binding domain-containing protein [Hirsutella rhossiliensis]
MRSETLTLFAIAAAVIAQTPPQFISKIGEWKFYGCYELGHGNKMRRTSLCGDMGSTGPTREGGFIGGSRKTFGPGLHASLHSSLPSFFSSFPSFFFIFSLLFIDYQYNTRIPTTQQFHYKDLTPDKCVGMCQKADYKYAGLRNSNECYCGDKADLVKSGVKKLDEKKECLAVVVDCGSSEKSNQTYTPDFQTYTPDLSPIWKKTPPPKFGARFPNAAAAAACLDIFS